MVKFYPSLLKRPGGEWKHLSREDDIEAIQDCCEHLHYAFTPLSITNIVTKLNNRALRHATFSPAKIDSSGVTLSTHQTTTNAYCVTSQDGTDALA